MNSSSRSQPVSALLGADCGDIGQRIVDRLERWQKGDVAKDTGHGYRSSREIREALGIPKAEIRAVLDKLAADGRIKRVDFTNGLAWRSVTPLPWEIPAKPKVQKPFVAAKPTFILQRQAIDCGRRYWFDVETFTDEARAFAALRCARASAEYSARRYDVSRAPQQVRIVVAADGALESQDGQLRDEPNPAPTKANPNDR